MIVGFPGETEDDVQTLCDFLEAARLDVVGVFGYSDEDGTEAASYDGKLDEDEIRERTEHVTRLVEELTAQRAEDRIGERVEVLSSRVEDGAASRAAPAHQGPEVDGTHHACSGLPAGRRGRRPRRPHVVDRRRRRGPGARRCRGGSRRARRPRADTPSSNWNVPNALTTLRIAAGAVLRLGCCSSTTASRSPGGCVAYLLFVAAMITDKVDGDLARKHNLVTNFGKIADPIADKALTGMALRRPVAASASCWWWVTVVILVREWRRHPAAASG